MFLQLSSGQTSRISNVMESIDFIVISKFLLQQ
jgi:hypothetical protein